MAPKAPPVKSPSPLQPFAHDWVGGDIHGLSSLAGTLYRDAPEIAEVGAALDAKVSQIAGDGGWRGDAAKSFTTAWDIDSIRCTALAVMVASTGDIADTLAVDLAQAENSLESAADKARSLGVDIGSDGKPPQACYADPAKEQWRLARAASR